MRSTSCTRASPYALSWCTDSVIRDEWLTQVEEEILEPELPICDPHHHLWDHPESRYLLDELLADTGSGHNVVSTVFMECGSMYWASRSGGVAAGG